MTMLRRIVSAAAAAAALTTALAFAPLVAALLAEPVLAQNFGGNIPANSAVVNPTSAAARARPQSLASCTGKTLQWTNGSGFTCGSSPSLSANNIWTGDQYFGSGRPWADIVAFGAVGNNSTDNHVADANAIATVAALGGGVIYVPSGHFCDKSGLDLTGSLYLWLVGEAWASSIDICGGTASTVTLDSGQGAVMNLQIFGPQFGAGAVVPTGDALRVTANTVDGKIFNNIMTWGRHGIQEDGVDNTFFGNKVVASYGSALVRVGGSGGEIAAIYSIRGKYDNPWPISEPGAGLTISAWASGTGYATGAVVTATASGGVVFWIQAQAACTSGGAQPTLLNQGTAIADNTCTWYLVNQSTFYGTQFDTGTSASFLWGDDDSGSFSASIGFTNTASGTAPSDVELDGITTGGAVSYGIFANVGNDLRIHGGEHSVCVGSGCIIIAFVGSWAGEGTVIGANVFSGATGIDLGAGANNKAIGNTVTGMTTQGIIVTGAATNSIVIGNAVGSSTAWGANANAIETGGTADYYTIEFNACHGATAGFTDGASGTHKAVGSACL
jgi:hypothetical protein